MATKSSFAPVVDARTRLLILGSLPGEQSLQAGRYYANPQNAFWGLVGAVIAIDLRALDYPERLQALRDHAIGLWDVVRSAQRQGSLDSAIRDLEAHDLPVMTASLPGLRAVAFNGGTAAKIGTRQLGGPASGYALVTLLSSSGACAVRADVKRADWLRLRQYLA